MAFLLSSIGPSGRFSVGLERRVRYLFPVELHKSKTAVGNIVLLQKSGDPLDPNRRPITLSTVDYKILAKALGNRLADVMPDIVGPLQTRAVRGKCIQHNLWLMRDLIEFVKVCDLPCALVSLDQEEAFDMVDHDFLFRTLESFGLNSVFIRWVSLLYKQWRSVHTVRGRMPPCPPDGLKWTADALFSCLPLLTYSRLFRFFIVLSSTY
ncbi:hypothetical protein BSL78_07485 [Apostichopus japonicus]|uniref:Reverse transcriptase domain-containing protein n=1 Tax=Stichopus japonicus TaxID=307972 RepID=A0A2G8L5U4_STIJA|nr:hypothetical protein BSL78_07485 [Apostichopus japonicus]